MPPFLAKKNQKTACSSSEIQQENPSKRQIVLNFPAKFAVADVLNQFMTFNPNFQAHWKMACKKEFFTLKTVLRIRQTLGLILT